MTSNECEKESKKALEDFYNYVYAHVDQKKENKNSKPQCPSYPVEVLMNDHLLGEKIMILTKCENTNEKNLITINVKGIVSCDSQNARFEFTEDKKFYIYPNNGKGTKITLLKQ